MRPEAVSQERGKGGGYPASPTPRIIGAPRRHTTPQRRKEKKKTETRKFIVRQNGAGSGPISRSSPCTGTLRSRRNRGRPGHRPPT